MSHRADPRVRGLILGGGPEADRLRELAGDDHVVQVLGERRDVPDMLSASDVSCLSSAAEGVPVSLLEAMALGKPVVASDVGGVAEAVVAENRTSRAGGRSDSIRRVAAQARCGSRARPPTRSGRATATPRGLRPRTDDRRIQPCVGSGPGGLTARISPDGLPHRAN
jgi:glycosyltransferase involved in cell wall biosynthesis